MLEKQSYDGTGGRGCTQWHKSVRQKRGATFGLGCHFEKKILSFLLPPPNIIFSDLTHSFFPFH